MENGPFPFWLFVICLFVIVPNLLEDDESTTSPPDPEPTQIEYTITEQTQQIADTLGSETREGFGNKEWDEDDRITLMQMLELPAHTQLEDVPEDKLEKFCTQHKNEP
jgi:hypothetical protein